VTAGRFLFSTLLGLLEQYCPRLEVLDADDCVTDEPIGCRMLFRWLRKLKVFRGPSLPYMASASFPYKLKYFIVARYEGYGESAW
jgi:hypothetical protein